jgi:hypothetical protein
LGDSQLLRQLADRSEGARCLVGGRHRGSYFAILSRMI